MTRDGMCGVFIPDRVLTRWWRSQWKASDRMWAGKVYIRQSGRSIQLRIKEHERHIFVYWSRPGRECIADVALDRSEARNR